MPEVAESNTMQQWHMVWKSSMNKIIPVQGGERDGNINDEYSDHMCCSNCFGKMVLIT